MISTVRGIFDLNHFDQSSKANDVIVIQHKDGSLHSTPFNVRFGKAKLWSRKNRVVQIEVNGMLTSAVMKIGSGGEAYWLQPTYGHFKKQGTDAEASAAVAAAAAMAEGGSYFDADFPLRPESPIDMDEVGSQLITPELAERAVPATDEYDGETSNPASRNSPSHSDVAFAATPADASLNCDDINAGVVAGATAGIEAHCASQGNAGDVNTASSSMVETDANTGKVLVAETDKGGFTVVKDAIHSVADVQDATLAIQALEAAEKSRKRLSLMLVTEDPYLLQSAQEEEGQDLSACATRQWRSAQQQQRKEPHALSSGAAQTIFKAAEEEGEGDDDDSNREIIQKRAAIVMNKSESQCLIEIPGQTTLESVADEASLQEGKTSATTRPPPGPAAAAAPAVAEDEESSSTISGADDLLYGAEEDDPYILAPLDDDETVFHDALDISDFEELERKQQQQQQQQRRYEDGVDLVPEFPAGGAAAGSIVASGIQTLSGREAGKHLASQMQRQASNGVGNESSDSLKAGRSAERTPRGTTSPREHQQRQCEQRRSSETPAPTQGESLSGTAGSMDASSVIEGETRHPLHATTDAASATLGADALKTAASSADASSHDAQTYFVRSLIPVEEDLWKLNLRGGCNQVRYLTRNSNGEEAVSVCCNIFLWDCTDRLVVSDIDGTITRSDLWGHFYSMLGKGSDWTHPGICSLFSKVDKNGYRMVYLTARSVTQINQTKNYLWSLEQDSERLPLGPVLTVPQRFFTALTQEVSKKSHIFKIACLTSLKAAFPSYAKPFFAGFGNRYNDVISYDAVGIPTHKIFIIDPSSVLHVCQVKQTYRNLSHLVDVTFPPVRRRELRHKPGQQGYPYHRGDYTGSGSDVASSYFRQGSGSSSLCSDEYDLLVTGSSVYGVQSEDGRGSPVDSDVEEERMRHTHSAAFNLRTADLSAGGTSAWASPVVSTGGMCTTESRADAAQQPKLQQQNISDLTRITSVSVPGSTMVKGRAVPASTEARSSVSTRNTAASMGVAGQSQQQQQQQQSQRTIQRIEPHEKEDDVPLDADFGSFNFWRIDPASLINAPKGSLSSGIGGATAATTANYKGGPVMSGPGMVKTTGSVSRATSSAVASPTFDKTTLAAGGSIGSNLFLRRSGGVSNDTATSDMKTATMTTNPLTTEADVSLSSYSASTTSSFAFGASPRQCSPNTTINVTGGPKTSVCSIHTSENSTYNHARKMPAMSDDPLSLQGAARRTVEIASSAETSFILAQEQQQQQRSEPMTSDNSTTTSSISASALPAVDSGAASSKNSSAVSHTQSKRSSFFAFPFSRSARQEQAKCQSAEAERKAAEAALTAARQKALRHPDFMELTPLPPSPVDSKGLRGDGAIVDGATVDTGAHSGAVERRRKSGGGEDDGYQKSTTAAEPPRADVLGESVSDHGNALVVEPPE